MSYGGASPIIDYGVINFVRNRREAKADFLRVGHTVPVHHLLRFLTKQWKLPDPGIIVQVTGSAHPYQHMLFTTVLPAFRRTGKVLFFELAGRRKSECVEFLPLGHNYIGP